jgi:hypothetical protein
MSGATNLKSTWRKIFTDKEFKAETEARTKDIHFRKWKKLNCQTINQ